jgi:hypothetical protein
MGRPPEGPRTVGRGASYVACFAVAVGAVGAELASRGAGCGLRRLDPKVERGQSGLEPGQWPGLDWTGLDWTGIWTLDNCERMDGTSSCGTPAESGAWTRLRTAEPIDRRSWPAGARIEYVWCDFSASTVRRMNLTVWTTTVDGTGDQRVLRQDGMAEEGKPAGSRLAPRRGWGGVTAWPTRPCPAASQAKQQSTPLE